MTSKLLLVATVLLAACGNYSNEDLEFMNAVPAREDLTATIPPAMILPANEAELARDTHDAIRTFNGALNFLSAADYIRTFPPTSRIADGRVWGPAAMDDHPGWQWRFVMRRDPATPEKFDYEFDVEPVGAGDQWIAFIDGAFLATGGARRGMGTFRIRTDDLRLANFTFAYGADGSLLKELDVAYSTAAFPVSVTMDLQLYPNASDIPPDFTTVTFLHYHHEAEENGQGKMEFSGTDATGKMLAINSRWLASGAGRADVTASDGMGFNGTWTECWDSSFRETFNQTSWDATSRGDMALCPDVSGI